jgi:hypothetical protein
MSEEDFLARWSRRKREAKADMPSSETARPVEAGDTHVPPDGEQGEPDVDLSSLPPIDSITAATDITAFLRKGIPQELTRAALRRAWTSDPVIRDFVGLAENAWDFNDPAAMPGFGPLDCTAAELSALVDRIVGGVRDVVESLPGGDASGDAAAEKAAPEREIAQQIRSATARNNPEAPARGARAESAPSVVASQQVTVETGEPVPRRRHGGALPRDVDDAS